VTLKEILNYELFTWNDSVVELDNIIFAILIIFLFPFFYLLLKKFFLNPFFKRKKMKSGRIYAFNRLIKYFFYIFTFLFVVSALGFNVGGLWTAGAALLVGVGLGLQETFNDFASGVILLIEGTVEKGDWIEVGDTVGEVKKIGLRTSLITTRRNISIIVPNSKITVDNVINLSHNNDKVIYNVSVGVAYGSDLALVKKVMLECANRHSKVLPNAIVRFVNFGDSSLDFELLFWSHEYQQIEDVRSDLRFMIDNAFRKFNISIPYPQQDLHIKESPVDITNSL